MGYLPSFPESVPFSMPIDSPQPPGFCPPIRGRPTGLDATDYAACPPACLVMIRL